MSTADQYEIKFHLYDGNEQDIDHLYEKYIILRDYKKTEEGVMAKVITHFYNGLISLVKGDKFFWERSYREAFLAYQESSRLFNNFTISRTVKAKLDKFVARVNHRANGMIFLTEGFLSSSPQVKDAKFMSGMDEFNSEISEANEMGDQMSSYAAFARASFNHSQILLYRAKSLPPNKSGESKKNILDSRDALRQAAFIDKRFLSYLEEINDQLDIVTRNRLLAKGEEFADQATASMENSKYTEAISGFKTASLFYKRASVLASDGSSRRMLLAFSTVYEASIHEAKATESQKDIQLVNAADHFLDSMKLVDKALALLGQFGTSQLVKSFQCQRDYYKGMYNLNKATQEFDVENYKDAIDMFVESREVFKNAIEVAKQVDNHSIINLSEDATNEINSYITMCENLA